MKEDENTKINAREERGSISYSNLYYFSIKLRPILIQFYSPHKYGEY